MALGGSPDRGPLSGRHRTPQRAALRTPTGPGDAQTERVTAPTPVWPRQRGRAARAVRSGANSAARYVSSERFPLKGFLIHAYSLGATLLGESALYMTGHAWPTWLDIAFPVVTQGIIAATRAWATDRGEIHDARHIRRLRHAATDPDVTGVIGAAVPESRFLRPHVPQQPWLIRLLKFRRRG